MGLGRREGRHVQVEEYTHEDIEEESEYVQDGASSEGHLETSTAREHR